MASAGILETAATFLGDCCLGAGEMRGGAPGPGNGEIWEPGGPAPIGLWDVIPA